MSSIALARLSEGWCPRSTHGQLRAIKGFRRGGYCRDCRVEWLPDDSGLCDLMARLEVTETGASHPEPKIYSCRHAFFDADLAVAKPSGDDHLRWGLDRLRRIFDAQWPGLRMPFLADEEKSSHG